MIARAGLASSGFQSRRPKFNTHTDTHSTQHTAQGLGMGMGMGMGLEMGGWRWERDTKRSHTQCEIGRAHV